MLNVDWLNHKPLSIIFFKQLNKVEENMPQKSLGVTLVGNHNNHINNILWKIYKNIIGYYLLDNNTL